MQIIILPYQKNSADLFKHFAHLPYAMFLDSCDLGRYDIIVAKPIQALINGDDIFAEIKKVLSSFQKHQQPSIELPFTVGAIGYLGYDTGRTDGKIPSDILLPDAVVGIYDWSIVVDHQAQKTYLTTLTQTKQNAVLSQMRNTPIVKKSFSLTTDFESNLTKENYQKAIKTIKKHIVAGDCYQVNFAQRFSATFSGDPWMAYQQLREKNPAPFSAFIRLPQAAILSSSPEEFLKIGNHHVITKPIKGTTKRYSDPVADHVSAEQLLKSEKDRAENVMIVDLLRNDLSRSCVAGSVKVPELCALESFKNVHHLVSTVTGTLKSSETPIDVLRHCFPGGSITGAPKISAMKIIAKLEPHRRSVYCGSIFYHDIFDRLDSNIAIRTVICDRNNIHCYAGGGIVYDSTAESEYEECFAKVGNIIEKLQEM